MLIGMGYAKVQIHAIQKIGFGQLDSARFEILRDLEAQPVGAHLQARMVEQRLIGTAIGVEHQLGKQSRLITFGAIKRHGHASCGAAMHGVENVGTQAHGESPVYNGLSGTDSGL